MILLGIILKKGFVNGFSIEGYFAHKLSEFSEQEMSDDQLLEEITKLLEGK